MGPRVMEKIAPATGTASPPPRLARITGPEIVQDLQDEIATKRT